MNDIFPIKDGGWSNSLRHYVSPSHYLQSIFFLLGNRYSKKYGSGNTKNNKKSTWHYQEHTIHLLIIHYYYIIVVCIYA